MTESGDTLSNDIITLNYSPVVPLSTVLNRRVMIIFRVLAIYSVFFLCCYTLFHLPKELENGFRWHFIIMSLSNILILWGFGNVAHRGKYTKTLLVVVSSYLMASLLYYAHLALLYFFNSIPYAMFSPLRIGDISLRTVALIYVFLYLRKVRILTRSSNNAMLNVEDSELIKNASVIEADSSYKSRLIWIAAFSICLITVIKHVGYPILQIKNGSVDWLTIMFHIPSALIFGLFCLLALRSNYLKMLLLICIFTALENIYFFQKSSEDGYILAFSLRMAHMILACIASICLGLTCLIRLCNHIHAALRSHSD